MKKRFATLMTTGVLLLATAMPAAAAPLTVTIKKDVEAGSGDTVVYITEVRDGDTEGVYTIETVSGENAVFITDVRDDDIEGIHAQVSLKSFDYANILDGLDLTEAERQIVLDTQEKTKLLIAQVDEMMAQLMEADEEEKEQLLAEIEAIMKEVEEISAESNSILEEAGLFFAATVITDEEGKITISMNADAIEATAIDYEDYVQSLDLTEKEKEELVDIHDKMMNIWTALEQEGMDKDTIDQYLFEIDELLQRQMEILGETTEFSIFYNDDEGPFATAVYAIEVAE